MKVETQTKLDYNTVNENYSNKIIQIKYISW